MYIPHIQYSTFLQVVLFRGQIRFLLVPDQPIVTLPRGTGRHNMWWLNKLPLLPDVVFIPCPVTRRAAAENSDMIIP